MARSRDHGGDLDAAIAEYGGTRSGWVDMSTGINPAPYPVPPLPGDAWTALPDRAAAGRLVAAARAFWRVPAGAAVLAVPGASAAIARIPRLAPAGAVRIAPPTYGEHEAAFRAAGWEVTETGPAAARVLVHPNNPDGRLWTARDADAPLAVIDESFCDPRPEQSLAGLGERPGTLVVKSFGKFWGLAGLRLGFVIGDPGMIAELEEMLGPWPVSGIALGVGAAALEDSAWAAATRARLAAGAERLDALLAAAGAGVVGGTPLFRLYEVDDAPRWRARLARRRVWSRVFPYSRTWLRLGLPPDHAWDRIGDAL